MRIKYSVLSILDRKPRALVALVPDHQGMRPERLMQIAVTERNKNV